MQGKLSRLWPGETVPAVELDEARRRHDPHSPQAVLLLLVQNDTFCAPGTDRLDQAPPRPELGGQRRRHTRVGGADHDRVERGEILGALGSGFPAKTEACGAISLRRHCPDQVLGSPFGLLAVGPLSLPAAKPGFPGQFVRSSSLSRLADKCQHARQGQHCPEAKVLDNRAERQPAAKRPRRRVRQCPGGSALARRPRAPVIDPRGSAGRCIQPLTAAGSPEGPYCPVGTGHSGQPWSTCGSCVTGVRARLRRGLSPLRLCPAGRRAACAPPGPRTPARPQS